MPCEAMAHKQVKCLTNLQKLGACCCKVHGPRAEITQICRLDNRLSGWENKDAKRWTGSPAGMEFPSVALPSWEMNWFIKGFAGGFGIVGLSRRAGLSRRFMLPGASECLSHPRCRELVSHFFFRLRRALWRYLSSFGLRLGFSGP